MITCNDEGGEAGLRNVLAIGHHLAAQRSPDPTEDNAALALFSGRSWILVIAPSRRLAKAFDGRKGHVAFDLAAVCGCGACVEGGMR